MPRLTKLTKLAQIALTALEDLKGQDIKVLDVQELTTVTDTMIVCTGTSSRHVKALAQNVVEDAKKAGFRPMGMEGTDAGEWVLVDLGGVVVHVMQLQARAFYQLEKLWSPREMAEPAEPARKPASSKKSSAMGGGLSKPAPRKAASTKKPAAKKAAGTRKSPAKPATKRAPAKKTAGRSTTAARPAARKAAVKKAAPRKAAVKKAPAKKTAARKTAAKKPR